MDQADTENVLPFWLRETQSGKRCALVTIVNIDGSAPRPLGSQMAVSRQGEFAGYLTGGCAEAAIAAEAQKAIDARENRCVRYGAGSPYLDIKLPCGSGLDLYFDISLDPAPVVQILEQLKSRRAAAMSIDTNAGLTRYVDIAPSTPGFRGGVFYRPYTPPLRLLIIGKGPICASLAEFARHAGIIVQAASPEATMLAQLYPTTERQHMRTPDDFLPGPLDAWTAAAMLFHEHDWEPPILVELLKSGCFYIGALGSRKTHQARKADLRRLGADEKAIDRIHGPIGEDIGASTPQEIAISILAEIIKTHRSRSAR